MVIKHNLRPEDNRDRRNDIVLIVLLNRNLPGAEIVLTLCFRLFNAKIIKNSTILADLIIGL